MQKVLPHISNSSTAILDQITEGVIITDADRVVQYVNKYAADILCIASEEAIGLAVSELYNVTNDIQQSILNRQLDGIVKTQQPQVGNVILINAEQQEILINQRIIPIVNGNGSEGFQIIFKNLTKENTLQKENTENYKKYRGLFEQGSEGVFFLDDKGNILDSNPQACALYNVKKEDFLRMNVKHIFPRKTSVECDLIWNDFKSSGHLHGVYKYILSNGTLKYIEFNAKAKCAQNIHLVTFKDITQKYQQEKTLKETETQLEAFFEASPSPTMLVDGKGLILMSNVLAKQWVKIYLGKSLDKTNILYKLFPTASTQLKEACENAIQNRQKISQELIIDKKNNTVIDIEILVLENPQSSSKIFSFVIKNIVDHAPVTALPANTEDHSKFYKLAENSPDLIYIIDIQKRSVVYFNRSELFGYSSKQLETSDGWIAIVHPDDIKQVKAHWNKFIKTAQDSESIEYRIKRKNDEYEWVLNRHSILERSADNQPLTILLNITIITDRKKAEQSLKESEARLLALIENTHDLIWSIDSDYNFTALNSAFKNIFKNTYKCIIEKGNNLMDCLPEKLNIEWLQLHRRALKGECFTTDFKISHKKNEQYFEVEFNPIHNQENDITGVSVFARNVSLRKKVEHEIIRTNFELDSFVYRASHDLRAPLRSVLGLINIIKTEEKADQRLTYLGLVDKSINKLDSFISDLTNFSRNSRLEIKHEKINFQEILNECIENLKYMDQAALVDVKIDIQQTIDFYSDPIRLAIIFQNLLSNSIKYHNHHVAKPEVIVKIVVNTAFCNIAVEDNGVGIKEQYMNQIFNMFFRATNDSYGSGLGLYITKQVVEKLKGVISVSSSTGLGTMFNIKFSLKKSHQIIPNLDI